MTEPHSYSISEIIDISTLQSIQDKFAKMLDLAAITVDEKGVPIVNASNFTGFCKLIRNSREGYRRCSLCDAAGSLKAMKSKSPAIYRCHTGLTDMAAPLMVGDTYLGGMLCGQVKIRNQSDKDIVDLKRLSHELDIPFESLEREFKKIPTISYEGIKDASEFLYIFANYIAKMGMATIAQSRLLEETREKVRLENLLKDIQIKTLQSQINPHFLFNTLNTIARIALIEGASNTEELIYTLSDLLRYSLKNSENMVKIETEVNNIKKYLYIQTVRYGDRIKYHIDMDNEILNSKIPVMTLQPIVENAIIHGLEKKAEGGVLSIAGKKFFNEYIIIEVSDNGAGIPEDRLKSIFNENRPDGNITGLGIQNVDHRIKYYFGKEYGLYIESRMGEGTKVFIKLPYVK